MSTENQPVSDLQLNQLKVEWVPYDTVRPNEWNPNRMTSHDRALLRQSILEDGWTQPIVTLLDGTIVDGEQRWTVAGMMLHTSDVDAVINKMLKRQEDGHVVSESILSRLREARRHLEEQGGSGTLASLTGGLIPITRVDFADDAHKMISTIRHNRARGVHNIDAMAEITQDLQRLGLDFDDLEERLGMSDEEAERLLEQVSLPEQLDVTDPSRAWRPAPLHELSDDEVMQREIQRSREASEQAKEYQAKLAERKQRIDRLKEERIAEAEVGGKSLTQDDKAKIERELEREIPKPEAPARTALRKIQFFVTEEEFETCCAVLGEPPQVQTFLQIVRSTAEQEVEDEKAT